MLMTGWRVRGLRLPDGEPMDAGIDGAGRWTSAPSVDAAELPGRFVLPGLVDAHCHLSVAVAEDGLPVPLDVPATRENLASAQAAGVTAIRDTGSPNSVTLQLLDDPQGGQLLACGRFLAPRDQYIPGLYIPVEAEDLVEAALTEIAHGARWVKLVADFPVWSADGPAAMAQPTYPMADVQRLIEAVHAAGARVAAHTTTGRVTELVDAGVDSVEHGPSLTDADVTALAARGGAWTPTLCALFWADPGEDAERRRKDAEARERFRYLLPRAVDLGVTLMTGTDVVGTVAREVAFLADLGLSPRQALAAASTAARQYLGMVDFQPGQLADAVTYDHDPSEDPAVLAHPAAVVTQGRRLR
jgi:imidazolonepropionase-like amidohydrolase